MNSERASLAATQAAILGTFELNRVENREMANVRAQAVTDAVEAFTQQAVYLVAAQETMARWMQEYAAALKDQP